MLIYHFIHSYSLKSNLKRHTYWKCTIKELIRVDNWENNDSKSKNYRKEALILTKRCSEIISLSIHHKRFWIKLLASPQLGLLQRKIFKFSNRVGPDSGIRGLQPYQVTRRGKGGGFDLLMGGRRVSGQLTQTKACWSGRGVQLNPSVASVG